MEAEKAASYLRERLGTPPKVAVVLGSGLAAALEVARTAEVPYRDIPFWSEGTGAWTSLPAGRSGTGDQARSSSSKAGSTATRDTT